MVPREYNTHTSIIEEKWKKTKMKKTTKKKKRKRRGEKEDKNMQAKWAGPVRESVCEGGEPKRVEGKQREREKLWSAVVCFSFMEHENQLIHTLLSN